MAGLNSMTRWWRALKDHAPEMVFSPLIEADDKAYGALVEAFLDKWKIHSKDVFALLAPEFRQMQSTGAKLGAQLQNWWIASKESLWKEVENFFDALSNFAKSDLASNFDPQKSAFLDTMKATVAPGPPFFSQLLQQADGLLTKLRDISKSFELAKSNTSAVNAVNQWWQQCSEQLKLFTSNPMDRALISAIGFGDRNLVTREEISPQSKSYLANADGDPESKWFVFPELPPERRSITTHFPRRDVELVIPGHPPEFAKAFEEASEVAAKRLWAGQSASLNEFHRLQAKSTWVACKALDVLLQPESLSDIAFAQEWFWQVGASFDEWMKGKLNARPADKHRMAATFITAVYTLVNNKIRPNWLARVSRGQSLSSKQAEPMACLIAFVMERLIRWEAEQSLDAPAANTGSIAPISLDIRPADRRDSYWLVVTDLDADRAGGKKRIPKLAVKLLEEINIGQSGEQVPVHVVTILRNAHRLLEKHLQVGKKIGNFYRSVDAPGLVGLITVQRHPQRPDRKHKS